MAQNFITNSEIELCEEFDDWAILFNPDTNEGYGLNPVSAFIWKQLDGRHSVDDIVAGLREACDVAPPECAVHVSAFIAALREKGLVGLVQKQGDAGKGFPATKAQEVVSWKI